MQTPRKKRNKPLLCCPAIVYAARHRFGDLFPVQKQTLLAALYFLFCVYAMSLLQIYSDFRAQDYPPGAKVIDTGFDLVPRIDLDWLSDTWVAVSMVLFFARILFTCHAQLIVRRWLLVQGSLYLLRGFTVACTTFPVPPESGGAPPLYLPANPFLGGLFILLGQAKTASDLVYSGHTTVWTTTAEFWIYYTSESSSWAALLYYIFNALGILSLISTRTHQTVDVLLAFVIAKGAVFSYHVVVVLLRSDPLYSCLVWIDNAPVSCHRFYHHVAKRFDWKHRPKPRRPKQFSIPALSPLPAPTNLFHRAPFIESLLLPPRLPTADDRV